MSSPFLRRTAFLTLTGYLSVLVAVACFHDHAHHHDSCTSCVVRADSGAYPEIESESHASHHCCSSEHHCPVDSGHLQESSPEEKPHQQPAPLHDDDCFVCRFLASKQVILPVLSVGEQVEKICLLEQTSVCFPDAPPLRLPPTRGPPRIL